AGAPRLLLLDEPTTGVDPRSRLEVWDLIDELAAGGTDVLLTTQYLEEADRLAGHIVIIDGGRVVASGPPAELKGQVGGNVLEVTVSDRSGLSTVAGVLARDSGSEPQVDEGARRVTVAMGAEGVADRFALGLRTAEESGVSVLSVTVRQATLNEVFLALTGRERAEATS
ncbi:daunorubicin/doxorubicin resistance ABC transporter ATP-binding protein DrrA, partial [Spirillospora sp. NPDC049652]